MADIRSVSLESGDIAVFDHQERTRHLPFFAELASLDDGNAAWRSVSAGLVVLRLVDAWIEEGAAAVGADGWGMRSVDAAIEEMPAGQPARAVLASVVDVLRRSSTGDMHAIAPRLMAYARALGERGEGRGVSGRSRCGGSRALPRPAWPSRPPDRGAAA